MAEQEDWETEKEQRFIQTLLFWETFSWDEKRSYITGTHIYLFAHLPNARMLNIWLNIKNNSSRKRIKNLGNVMQQTMHSYVCGINLRSESSLVLSDLYFTKNRCTRIRQERVYRAKSKCDPMRITL